MYSWNFFEVEMRPSARTHVYIKKLKTTGALWSGNWKGISLQFLSKRIKLPRYVLSGQKIEKSVCILLTWKSDSDVTCFIMKAKVPTVSYVHSSFLSDCFYLISFLNNNNNNKEFRRICLLMIQAWRHLRNCLKQSMIEQINRNT